MPHVDPQFPLFDASALFELPSADGSLITIYGMYADDPQMCGDLIAAAPEFINAEMRAQAPLICGLIESAGASAKQALSAFEASPDRHFNFAPGSNHNDWWNKRVQSLTLLLDEAKGCMRYAIDVAKSGGVGGVMRPALVSMDDYVIVAKTEGQDGFEFVLQDDLGIKSSRTLSPDSIFASKLRAEGFEFPEDVLPLIQP